MTRWNLFVGVAVFTLVVLLALARASAEALSSDVDADADAGTAPPPSAPMRPADATLRGGEWTPTTFGLLVNVALSHGLIGGVLVGAVWYAEIPPGAIGLDVAPAGVLPVGVGLGVGLYAANEVAAKVTERSGIEHDERLRELLAPDSAVGWVVLLVGVLPVIAGVEELLFRGALVGVVAAGYGVSPWLLAVVSSVLFGVGHGLQGPGGIVVTAALGFVLAVAYVVTGSLLAVVVAHYLVNALEFVVHEGFELEW